MITNNSQTPKANQFTEELNALLEKYQFVLIPQLQVTVDGIVPTIALNDMVSPKKEVQPVEGTSGAIAKG